MELTPALMLIAETMARGVIIIWLPDALIEQDELQLYWVMLENVCGWKTVKLLLAMLLLKSNESRIVLFLDESMAFVPFIVADRDELTTRKLLFIWASLRPAEFPVVSFTKSSVILYMPVAFVSENVREKLPAASESADMLKFFLWPE